MRFVEPLVAGLFSQQLFLRKGVQLHRDRGPSRFNDECYVSVGLRPRMGLHLVAAIVFPILFAGCGAGVNPSTVVPPASGNAGSGVAANTNNAGAPPASAATTPTSAGTTPTSTGTTNNSGGPVDAGATSGATSPAQSSGTNSTSTAGGTSEVDVSSPLNGETVSAQFSLAASDSICKTQSVSAMAYSIDNGSDITTVNAQSLSVQVSAAAGSHTLHVKSWGNQGAGCVTDVTVNIAGSGGNGESGPSIPSNAVSVSNLQTMSNWKQISDSGSGGWSSGSMSMVGSPSQSGAARQLITQYTNAGGERYYVTFGNDTSAHNFVYDAWVYLDGSTAAPANIEMDMNQVMPNGQTAIFGFQCDGYSGTWDYTENSGTPQNPVDHWLHSSAQCNPGHWSPNVWHHIQVEYSRDDSGEVTYKTVYFDGIASGIGATVPSAFALGWAPALLTNFQVDGRGASGSIAVNLDNVTIYRW